VGLGRGPLSLLNITEELLERNSSSSGLEIREYGRRDPLRSPSDILYPQKLAVTLQTSGDHSVGIVRSRTKATEFVLLVCTYRVGRTPWTKDRLITKPLPTHRTTKARNKHIGIHSSSGIRTQYSSA
jgi:hypothetical protein